jgi:hemerythrin-like domain-containing protein
MMDEYLNQEIKEIITKFPEIESILDEYEIGCGPCMVGTCLLKDIVDIHNLESEMEREMMNRIAQIIYPDKEIKIPELKKPVQIEKKLMYSPPMSTLVNEHKLILRMIALIPHVLRVLDDEDDFQLILDSLDFIRYYADKYHHEKEEDVLFKYFDEDLEIVKVMHEDHTKARRLVRETLIAVENEDKDEIKKNLVSYRETLLQHIKREDEILYPWMDRELTMTQTGELYSKFNEIADELRETSEKYELFVSGLESRFSSLEVIK